MTTQDWAGAVTALIRQLDTEAAAGEWAAADGSALALATLLATAPAGAGTAAVFRHACRAVGRVSRAAANARDAVRDELHQLTIGRRALAAYRRSA